MDLQKPKRVLVIAGNYVEFSHYCAQRSFAENEAVFINNANQLRGFGPEASRDVVLVGRFDKNPAYPLYLEGLRRVEAEKKLDKKINQGRSLQLKKALDEFANSPDKRAAIANLAIFLNQVYEAIRAQEADISQLFQLVNQNEPSIRDQKSPTYEQVMNLAEQLNCELVPKDDAALSCLEEIAEEKIIKEVED